MGFSGQKGHKLSLEFYCWGKSVCCMFSLGKERTRGSLHMGSPRSPLSPLPYDPAACLYCVCMLTCFSCVWLFVTLWTVAHQVPLSMGFSREEYWSGLLCPPLGDLPDPGFEHAALVSPALAGVFFTSSTTIIVINISHEYSYMLCPVTPSSEHPNIVLWAPDTYVFGISVLLYHYVTAFYCDIMNSLYVGLVSPPTGSWKTEICLICTSILYKSLHKTPSRNPRNTCWDNEWINERNIKATSGWGHGFMADYGQVAEML